jgi:hypothetical protein
VSSVKYEIGFYIPEDDILQLRLVSFRFLPAFSVGLQLIGHLVV